MGRRIKNARSSSEEEDLENQIEAFHPRYFDDEEAERECDWTCAIGTVLTLIVVALAYCFYSEVWPFENKTHGESITGSDSRNPPITGETGEEKINDSIGVDTSEEPSQAQGDPEAPKDPNKPKTEPFCSTGKLVATGAGVATAAAGTALYKTGMLDGILGKLGLNSWTKNGAANPTPDDDAKNTVTGVNTPDAGGDTPATKEDAPTGGETSTTGGESNTITGAAGQDQTITSGAGTPTIVKPDPAKPSTPTIPQSGSWLSSPWFWIGGTALSAGLMYMYPKARDWFFGDQEQRDDNNLKEINLRKILRSQESKLDAASSGEKTKIQENIRGLKKTLGYDKREKRWKALFILLGLLGVSCAICCNPWFPLWQNLWMGLVTVLTACTGCLKATFAWAS